MFLLLILIQRWQRLARHDTFNAVMAAIVGWAAVAGVIAFLAPENYRVMIGEVFTFGYVICVGAYFYSDYRRVHKKRGVKTKFPPLSTETVETPKLTTKVRSKWAIALEVLFVTLEAFEAVFFISMILAWQTFTINNMPVLTYQNAFLLGVFIFGLFLAIDVVRRLRSKKAFFGDE
jgi:hypothetical protein